MPVPKLEKDFIIAVLQDCVLLQDVPARERVKGSLDTKLLQTLNPRPLLVGVVGGFKVLTFPVHETSKRLKKKEATGYASVTFICSISF